LSKCCLW